MKKILLCICLLSTFAAGLVGCSQQRQWNHEQRKAMREALRSYRQMVYLDDLSDDEFVLFTDEVAGDLEGAYPVYTTFVEMPGVTDTVDMVVVTTIVDELNADAHNMRHTTIWWRRACFPPGWTTSSRRLSTTASQAR